MFLIESIMNTSFYFDLTQEHRDLNCWCVSSALLNPYPHTEMYGST